MNTQKIKNEMRKMVCTNWKLEPEKRELNSTIEYKFGDWKSKHENRNLKIESLNWNLENSGSANSKISKLQQDEYESVLWFDLLGGGNF